MNKKLRIDIEKLVIGGLATLEDQSHCELEYLSVESIEQVWQRKMQRDRYQQKVISEKVFNQQLLMENLSNQYSHKVMNTIIQELIQEQQSLINLTLV